jgi:hypothetical protein
VSVIAIPEEQWAEFLEGFSGRHRGWLVTLKTHDVQTGETVDSRYMPLSSIELDTEDAKNPRINVSVKSDNKLVKHVFFRPSGLTLHLSKDGAEESIDIESMNTSTTVRFRAAVLPDLVDGVA